MLWMLESKGAQLLSCNLLYAGLAYFDLYPAVLAMAEVRVK